MTCGRKIGGAILLAVIFSLIILTWFYGHTFPVLSRAVPSINYGEAAPEASVWFARHGERAELLNRDEIDTSVPGEYNVLLSVDNRLCTGRLIVEDRVPPTAESTVVYTLSGQEKRPVEFIAGCSDVSDVSFAFAIQPDFSTEGRRNVEIVLTDAYGNSATVTSVLSVADIADSLMFECDAYNPIGISLTAADFSQSRDVELLESPTPYKLRHVGEYDAVLSFGGLKYTSKIIVRDTLPPEITVRDLYIGRWETCAAADFIESSSDQSGSMMTAEFSGTEPDYSFTGSPQSLTVKVSDEYGNFITAPVLLTISADGEPPVITENGDAHITAGDKPTYRSYVMVTDNSGDAKLSVDSSHVDPDTPGIYDIIYTATDNSGNTTQKTVTFTVYEVSKEEVDALVDEILESLNLDTLTTQAKLKKINYYVTTHISYVNHSEKPTVYKGAYNALKLKQGDCYTYYALSEVMLTRAGIENIGIKRLDGRTDHYWNLVHVDGLWYHYDSTPSAEPRQNFDKSMFTGKLAESFSRVRYNYYNYDASLYPEIAYDWPVSDS